MDRDLACSVQGASSGEPAAGSAGLAQHIVAVTLPLPWPARIEEHPLLDGADLSGKLVLGITNGEDWSGIHTVLSFRAHGGGVITDFSSYRTDTTTADLADTFASLITAEHHPTQPHSPIELLICTHGTRDRCCGRSGTLLHAEVLAAAPDGVMAWRASHLGGHRFAPTVLSLPDGLSWAFMDAELLLSVLERQSDPELLVSHLRGHMGASTRPAQAADAALFAEFGWAWLSSPRSFSEHSDDRVVRVKMVSEAVAEAQVIEVVAQEPIPIPICGEPIENSVKSFTPLDAEATPSPG